MSQPGLNRLKYELIPRMKRKCLQDRGMTYRIAAVAFTKKGNFIDIRYNNHRMYMSHRKGAGLHAEQDLIHLYGNKIDTIYILRVGGTGNYHVKLVQKLHEKEELKSFHFMKKLI